MGKYVSKRKRQLIFEKYQGSCTYCGHKLEPGWHVDEQEPVIRNTKYDPVKKRHIHDGTYKYPERFILDNQFPACPSCNVNKQARSIEDFRAFVSNTVKRLNENSVYYRFAKRYGLIIETGVPVLFRYEGIKEILRDRKKRLICIPYSVSNLYRLTRELNPTWIHFEESHYIYSIHYKEQIKFRSRLVKSSEIDQIISGELNGQFESREKELMYIFARALSGSKKHFNIMFKMIRRNERLAQRFLNALMKVHMSDSRK